MTDKTLHAPLIIDVAGTELNAADRRRLADPLVGGVIHFARNWNDRAQMTALNAEIKAIRPDMLVCVDHEGGRVQRFRTDGFTRLPASMIVVIGYGLSFWFLALALKHLELSLVYAVWAGLGTAAIAVIGIASFGEPATAMRLGSIALVIAGVIGLNFAGAH